MKKVTKEEEDGGSEKDDVKVKKRVSVFCLFIFQAVKMITFLLRMSTHGLSILFIDKVLQKKKRN